MNKRKITAKKTIRRKPVKKTVRKKKPVNSYTPIIISQKEASSMPAKKRTSKKRTARPKARTRTVVRYAGEKPRKRRVTRRYYSGSKTDIVKPIVNTAIAVGGGVAGSIIANKLPIADSRIKAALPLGLGIALGMSKIGRKNKMAEAAATGMMIVGGLALLRQFAPTLPLLAGENDIDVTDVNGNLLGAPVDLMGIADQSTLDDYEELSADDFEESEDFYTSAAI